MEHYLTISRLSYETHLSQEEFEKTKWECIESIVRNADEDFMGSFYAEALIYETNGIVKWDKDMPPRFYHAHLLAELIRRTIKPGTEVRFFFLDAYIVCGYHVTCEKAELIELAEYLPQALPDPDDTDAIYRILTLKEIENKLITDFYIPCFKNKTTFESFKERKDDNNDDDLPF